LRIRETIGHVLIAVVVIGLIVLVYWIVTERPCPRYPGIEKLRGGAGAVCPGLFGLVGIAADRPAPVADDPLAPGGVTRQS
jgi:hypothetical protein